jgi:hypothetical protein
MEFRESSTHLYLYEQIADTCHSCSFKSPTAHSIMVLCNVIKWTGDVNALILSVITERGIMMIRGFAMSCKFQLSTY